MTWLAIRALPWKLIGATLGVLVIAGLLWAHMASDSRTRRQLADLTEQAGQVLFATRQAADNPDLKWKDVPGQVVALGESNKALKGEIRVTNQRIDEMAAEAVRLKARAAELKVIADKAQAQRQSALRKLSDMSITPGTRDDCMTLLAEAETALDLVYGASK